ncbi:MAG: LPS assembly lipoprotein LptE [Alphaproteobacteria bacterium]
MMKKLIALTASALFLTACGFTPMHAPQTGGADMPFKNIKIDLIAPEKLSNQEGGYWVLQSLQDRLGTQGSAHTLTVNPIFNRRGVGISSSDIATRYDMVATVPYKLIDSKTGDVLDSGVVKASSSFGAPRDPYGRSIAEQTAVKNVAKAAADRMIIKLAAYYKTAGKTKDDTTND